MNDLARARLELRSVTQSFDGVTVLRGVSLRVQAGVVVGLIGPNGAGKTTLFNTISGFNRSPQGSVLLDGDEIGLLSVEARALRGLVRTFQKSLVFPRLTVLANVEMSVRMASGVAYRWFNSQGRKREMQMRAEALLAQAGLDGRAGALASALSYGESRMLDLCIALAQAPRILLLDEPTAGLSERESLQVLQLIGQRPENTSVLLVSHDMDVIFQACQYLYVLDSGQVISHGTPHAVRQDTRVLSAYLGAPTPAEVAL